MCSVRLSGSDVEEEVAAAMALGQDSDEFSVKDSSEEDSVASGDAGELLHHGGVHSSCAYECHQPVGSQYSGCKGAATGLP